MEKLSKDFIIYKLQDKKIPWNKIYLIFDLQNNRIFKHCSIIGMDIIIMNELQTINQKVKELGWI